jgi:hypothetical protein
MAHGSYKSTPNRIMDEDSYRDANGVLRRNTLPHTATTFEFSTPYIHLAKKQALQALLPSRVKLAITYWNDETNTYTTGDFYIPDVTYEIYSKTDTDIVYKPVNFQFIQY